MWSDALPVSVINTWFDVIKFSVVISKGMGNSVWGKMF